MANSYLKKIRTRVETIVDTVTDVKAIHYGYRALQSCADFPAFMYQVASDNGNAAEFSTSSEMRTLSIRFSIIAVVSNVDESMDQVEEISADIRKAFDDDNETGASRLALGITYLHWLGMDVEQFYPTETGEHAIADGTNTVKIKRLYGTA
jgi:hypothetical protein